MTPSQSRSVLRSSGLISSHRVICRSLNAFSATHTFLFAIWRHYVIKISHKFITITAGTRSLNEHLSLAAGNEYFSFSVGRLENDANGKLTEI